MTITKKTTKTKTDTDQFRTTDLSELTEQYIAAFKFDEQAATKRIERQLVSLREVNHDIRVKEITDVTQAEVVPKHFKLDFYTCGNRVEIDFFKKVQEFILDGFTIAEDVFGVSNHCTLTISGNAPLQKYVWISTPLKYLQDEKKLIKDMVEKARQEAHNEYLEENNVIASVEKMLEENETYNADLLRKQQEAKVKAQREAILKAAKAKQ